MAAPRLQYQIVGRYMNGKEVTGYHLSCLSNGKQGRYTREQVIFLVGGGRITNCEGQIYKDKVLLRGVGMSLDDLPVKYEDGKMKNTDQLGHIKRGSSTDNVMANLTIIGSLRNGRNTVGYVVRNAGGGEGNLSRDKVIELASAGRIGNARVQNYNGRVILRGINCNLDELPSKSIGK